MANLSAIGLRVHGSICDTYRHDHEIPLALSSTTLDLSPPLPHASRITRPMSVGQPPPAAAPSTDTPAAKIELPVMQKAWRAMRSGKPADVLALVDVPVPAKLKKGEVLVKVQAAALNPV